MKIKQTRQVRLDELLRYIVDYEVVSFAFKSNLGNVVEIDIKGNTTFKGIFNYEEFFTVFEEVEIDYNTTIDLIVVKETGRTEDFKGRTIQGLLSNFNAIGAKAKFIYLQNEDGSIGELIWKDGKLI